MSAPSEIPSRLKVCVVGGASTYTPELVEGFANRWPELPVEELVLFDIDAERLAVVGGLADRILTDRGWPGRLVLSSDRTASLSDAHYVVCQLRVGGQTARFVDETLPHEFGCIGQETTGPGGFAKALRTVPVVLDLAAELDRVGAPGAWFVNFTNPVGIVTQALLDAGHRAIGLCNVAIGLQRRIAAALDVAPDRVELEHVGLNHLTWERAVRIDGVDRLDELLGAGGEHWAAHLELSLELMRTLHTLPSYYLRYYYQPDEVLAEQLAGPSRAEEVIAIERELLAMYADPALRRKPDLLAERGGAFYSEAAAALIASLHAGTGDVQVVDIRNDGTLAGLADDDVVEVPARITRDGAVALKQSVLAPEIGGLVGQVKAYERLAAAAAVRRDRRLALEALLANPLVPSWGVAERLLPRLLAANRAHLPGWDLSGVAT
ncbi:MAG TPA: 6-phospho-beta-glucosidase [Mycobacteriales bacterium]|nr:6-phospho-beta-glucosidase [Mycobacteriales bacterium]